jgi:hypothetical protein
MTHNGAHNLQCLTESEVFKRAIELQNRGFPRIFLEQNPPASTDLPNGTSATQEGKLIGMESWLRMQSHLNVCFTHNLLIP